MKQKYNENIIEYSKRLKQAKDILEEYVDKNIMVHYVENVEELRTRQVKRGIIKLNMKSLIIGWLTY